MSKAKSILIILALLILGIGFVVPLLLPERNVRNWRYAKICEKIVQVRLKRPSSLEVDKIFVTRPKAQVYTDYFMEYRQRDNDVSEDQIRSQFEYATPHMVTTLVEFSAKNGMGGYTRGSGTCVFLEKHYEGNSPEGWFNILSAKFDDEELGPMSEHWYSTKPDNFSSDLNEIGFGTRLKYFASTILTFVSELVSE